MANPRYKPDVLQKMIDEYFDGIDQSGSMPTLSGLCRHLKYNMDTMRDMARSKKKEYSEIARDAYARLTTYWEPLLAGQKNTSGVQFWLKCVNSWRDADPRESKTEVRADTGGIKVTITAKEGLDV